MAVLLSTDATAQQRAHAALGELLTLPLAAASWTIRRNGTLDIVLDGRLPDYLGENWRGEVLRYADLLGLDTRRTPMPGHPGSTMFEACGKWRGVYVSVWTPMTAEDRKAWGR